MSEKTNGKVEELDTLTEQQEKIAELEEQLAAKDQQIQSLAAQLETAWAYEREYSRESIEARRALANAQQG